MNSNSILSELVQGKIIDLDKYSDPKSVYEFIDYYEMNLYAKTVNSDLSQEIDKLKEINRNNIALFNDEMKKISNALIVNGVKYCVMVGLPFTARYHERPSLRFQEDIDFCVSISDLPIVTEIMKDLQYNLWNSDEKKKHVTFINEGKTGCDTSRNGRIAVKFYRRFTDYQFCNIDFESIISYLEDYEGYKVLCPEMAFVHLLLHAHYYDFHPKILCDIYAIANSGKLDYRILKEIISKFKVERLFNIIMGILSRLGLHKYTDDISDQSIAFICDIFSSDAYWKRFFTRLNKQELTLLRCFLFDSGRYREIDESIIKANMERRVSPMRNEFNF